MDTSEQYKKMCEKAEEIQEHKPMVDLIGSVFWDTQLPKKYCETCEIYIDSKFCPDCGNTPEVEKQLHRINTYRTISPFAKGVWLPRQDQLQAMFCTNGYVLSQMIEGAIEDWLALGECPSMEQLWLAFVMKERHNKIWNGEEWRDDGRG